MNSLFGVYLVEKGLATPGDIVKALDRQRELQEPLGSLALSNHFLSMKQVFTILNTQAATGQRFGDIALELGYLTRPQLQELLDQQNRKRPMLGQLLVEMGVLEEHIMQSHHDDYSRRAVARRLADPGAEAVVSA